MFNQPRSQTRLEGREVFEKEKLQVSTKCNGAFLSLSFFLQWGLAGGVEPASSLFPCIHSNSDSWLLKICSAPASTGSANSYCLLEFNAHNMMVSWFLFSPFSDEEIKSLDVKRLGPIPKPANGQIEAPALVKGESGPSQLLSLLVWW